MDERIPIISLWQPWANWVSLGWKTIETRLHDKHKSLKGKRIGIHAALKWDKSAIEAAEVYLTEEQINRSMKFLKIGGAVLCTALVDDFRLLTDQDSQAALIDCGNFSRFGLVLKEIQSIEAIPARGKQGIWYL